MATQSQAFRPAKPRARRRYRRARAQKSARRRGLINERRHYLQYRRKREPHDKSAAAKFHAALTDFNDRRSPIAAWAYRGRRHGKMERRRQHATGDKNMRRRRYAARFTLNIGADHHRLRGSLGEAPSRNQGICIIMMTRTMNSATRRKFRDGERWRCITRRPRPMA